MASLVHALSERKSDSSDWNNFHYIDDKKKSMCMVVDTKDTNKPPCGFEVSGTNPTNLKTHLQSRHLGVYATLNKEEDDKKKAVKRKHEESTSSGSGNAQTVASCFYRNITSWPMTSREYTYRLEGILQMLISSGGPVTMVDDEDYRESLRRLYPKCALPGV